MIQFPSEGHYHCSQTLPLPLSADLLQPFFHRVSLDPGLLQYKFPSLNLAFVISEFLIKKIQFWGAGSCLFVHTPLGLEELRVIVTSRTLLLGHYNTKTMHSL